MRIRIAIKMTLLLAFLTGVLYPLLMVLLAQVIFPWQANGSLIVRNGRVLGSALIGQNFDAPQYFHPRPPAAGDKGYDATSSGGSNLGPANKALIGTVAQRLRQVLKTEPGAKPAQVPIDLMTASGSGLDPEISPQAAELQAPRVARARGLSEEQARALVAAHTRGRWAGILGEPGVNVLELNLALDDLSPARSPVALNRQSRCMPNR